MVPELIRGVWGIKIEISKDSDYPREIQEIGEESRYFFQMAHYRKSETGQQVRRMLRFWEEMVRNNQHLLIGSPDKRNTRYNARSHVILPQSGLLTISLSLDPGAPTPDQYCDVYLQTRNRLEFEEIGHRCREELGMTVKRLDEFRYGGKSDPNDFHPPFDPTPSDFYEHQ